MSKRQLVLSAGLALVLLVCGVLSIDGSADDDQWFRGARHPMLRLGGLVEKTLRIVPPMHKAIWPPMPVFG